MKLSTTDKTRYEITVIVPTSDTERVRWVFHGSFGEDGKLSYTDGVKTVEVLGEDGQYAAQSQVTGTRGSLVLNKDTGRLSWTEETEGSAKDMAFAKKS